MDIIGVDSSAVQSLINVIGALGCIATATELVFFFHRFFHTLLSGTIKIEWLL